MADKSYAASAATGDFNGFDPLGIGDDLNLRFMVGLATGHDDARCLGADVDALTRHNSSGTDILFTGISEHMI
ncbi:MAG: hypothetical protein R3E01_20510 [Pirellulaceae bacterium]|nr:hypothetical protein [Planctomycetales bacterium]